MINTLKVTLVVTLSICLLLLTELAICIRSGTLLHTLSPATLLCLCLTKTGNGTARLLTPWLATTQLTSNRSSVVSPKSGPKKVMKLPPNLYTQHSPGLLSQIRTRPQQTKCAALASCTVDADWPTCWSISLEIRTLPPSLLLSSEPLFQHRSEQCQL